MVLGGAECTGLGVGFEVGDTELPGATSEFEHESEDSDGVASVCSGAGDFAVLGRRRFGSFLGDEGGCITACGSSFLSELLC